MEQEHKHPQSLSGKIFNTVLVFTLAVIMAFSVLTTVIFYWTYEHEAEEELAQQARDAAAYLNATPSDANAYILESQFGGWVRYTLIASDGTVIYDSVPSETTPENHASRPEVKGAEEAGQATSNRFSNTLGTDTIYAAVKLDDGSIVRLAETRHSLLSFLGNMVWPMIISVAVVALLVFFLSRILTKRIMKPIDALNFKDPLENDIYEEMTPLLERMDEQQSLLKQQNKELALATSMRRDFSSNVSHEMKTPLQVISGYAELMKNDMVQPEDRLKIAGLIYDEAQAMRSLIDDVLTLSRLDESAISDNDLPIDLYAIARGIVGRLEAFAASRKVAIHLEGSSATIVGSETMAEQMLYNLLENGVRYNHEGGDVFMTINGDEDGAHIVVRDTGNGIAPDMYDKIFERFFRIDKSRSKETGGTGLGLAIVKHAVLYHGGTIEVQSKVGEGTAFLLDFPRADD